ncbi:MAG TPA: FG-GAP-like repeat-containing protein [Thermoanaerobaculia bacterium]|nr:FG-GAP-like repeat-containing protein [Thermoanaerobaculia bacterium]
MGRGVALASGVVALGLLATGPVSAQCTGCSNPSFLAPRAYSAIGASYCCNSSNRFALGDFNRDGYTDLVSQTSSFPAALAVFPGNPNGHFGDSIGSASTANPLSELIAADFDGDGNLDVLGNSQYYPYDFYLFRGKGDGTFFDGQPLGFGQGFQLASGDFNGDGIPDVAYASSTGVLIRLGHGDGSFASPAFLPTGSNPDWVTAADVNGDGVSDLVVSTYTSGVAVILGSLSGLFGPATLYDVGGTYPGPPVVADLSGDGMADIAVSVGTGIVWLRGVGSGAFAVGGTIPLSNVGLGLAAGDFDADGTTDLLAVSSAYYQPSLTLLHGTGGGNFVAAATTFDSVSNPFLLVADLNHDGLADVVAGGSNSFVVFLSAPGTGLDLPGSVQIDSFVSLAIADFNGDAKSDVAVASYNGVLRILFGSASGSLVSGPTSTYPSTFSSLASTDFDGDGKADLAALDSGGHVSVLLGNGAGSFSSPHTQTVTPGGNLIAVADLNGDGKPDVIVANAGMGSLSVLLGAGNGSLLPPRSFAVGPQPLSLAVADFDGDGHQDVAVATSGMNAFTLMFGDGAGGFRSILLVSTDSQPTSLVAGDFNGDGFPDVAVGMANPPIFLRLYFGDGTGSFVSSPYASLPAVQLVAADFNQDGWLDLGVSSSTVAGIGVLMNDGSGHFGEPFIYSGGSHLGTGDFDGDGRPDIVAAQTGVTTLLNTTCRPRHLGIATDVPLCPPADTVLVPQPALSVLDDAENVITCASGGATASLVPGSGPPGASLGGTTTASISSGTASFTDLAVSPAGFGYQVQFDSTFGSVRSRVFSTSPIDVSISGPSSICAGTVATYDAGPGFDSYRWLLDGVPVGSGRTVLIAPAPGAHSLQVTVTEETCSATGSLAIAASPAVVATILHPASVCAASLGNTASVPGFPAGTTYNWSITNGTITSGQATASITFTAGPSGAVGLTVSAQVPNGCVSHAAVSVPVGICGSFYTLTPCRLIDTRKPNGSLGGPALVGQSARTFGAFGNCGIPPTARTLAANITVTQSTADGFLSVYPLGAPAPGTSTINYRTGQTRANNTLVSLDGSGAFVVQCGQAGGQVNVILDVTGYFE